MQRSTITLAAEFYDGVTMFAELPSNLPEPIQPHERDPFPADFRTSPKLPPGRSLEDVVAEKERNREGILALAAPFEGAAKALVEAAGELAMLAHFNQYRGGPGSAHYSEHLLEVARRSARLAAEAGIELPAIDDRSGAALPPEAVLLAVALLHDTLEDFPLNVADTCSNHGSARRAMREKIVETLSAAAGPEAARRILEDIERLTNDNPTEFPDSVYREKFASSPYSRAVKLADLDHNLETAPSFDPAYYLTASPLVIGALGLPDGARAAISGKLVPCLEKLDILREPSARPGLDETLLSRYLARAAGYDGQQALCALEKFYSELAPRLEGRAATALAELGGAVAAERARLGAPLQPFHVRSSVYDGTPVRILGPIEMWGGEICAQNGESAIRSAVEGVCIEQNLRISGYFSETTAGTVFHVSRLPRRAGMPVVESQDLELALAAVSEKLRSEGATAALALEGRSQEPQLRAVMGLDEGYFDQRRKQLLARLERNELNLEQALEAAENELGEAGKSGSSSGAESLELLTERLSALRLGVTYSPDEVRKRVDAAGGSVRSGRIYSCAPGEQPGSVSIYEEPIAIVTGPRSAGLLHALVRTGDDLKQARFSVEHLDLGLATNLEVLAFSGDRSAQKS